MALLQSSGGASMVFGGPVRHDALHLIYLNGQRTGSLAGLPVRRGAGLGGKCWQAARIWSVDEYGTSSGISHDYDDQVRSEGLRAVVAAPVLRGRRVQGVIYAGLRDVAICGDRLRDLAASVARGLANDLEIEDSVLERTRVQQQEIAQLREQLRRIHAGLRALRSRVPDAETRAALESLVTQPSRLRPSATPTPRQLDVLSLVAEGLSYAAIADALSLAPQTVKSYMRDLNRKLGTRSRHEAVVRARQLDLLP